MKDDKIKWYQVKVDVEQLTGGQARAMAYLVYHDEVFLSPHVRLAGNKAALIDTKELAQAYANACEPVFAKRGQTVTLTVVPRECPDTRHSQAIHARIQEHSQIIQARLDQNIMAANKKPKLSADAAKNTIATSIANDEYTGWVNKTRRVNSNKKKLEKRILSGDLTGALNLVHSMKKPNRDEALIELGFSIIDYKRKFEIIKHIYPLLEKACEKKRLPLSPG